MRSSIVCAFVLAFSIPIAAAPDSAKPEPIDDSARIAALLLERMNWEKGDEKIPLKDILGYLQDRAGLSILFDTKSLREKDEAILQTINDATISLPSLKQVRVETVLRRIVDQLDLEFVITPDHVSITTAATKDLLTGQSKRLPELYPAGGNDEPQVGSDPAIPLRTTPFVTVAFKETSAVDAFKEVSSRAGRTIVISQAAAEKAKSPVSVHLSNVAFETAAASLAEAAGLRAFRNGNTVVIVTPERAKQVDEQYARLNPSFLGPTIGFVDPGAAEAKLKELEEKIKKLTEELEKSKK